MKFLPLFLLILSSCFSNKKAQKIADKGGYQVISASSTEVPMWLTDMDEWASKQSGDKKYVYFAGYSELAADLGASCSMAKQDAMTQIQDSVMQAVRQKYMDGMKKEPNAKLVAAMQAAVAEVAMSVTDTFTHQMFWQERDFRAEYGADFDRKGFYCAQMVRMADGNMDIAVNRMYATLAKNASFKKELTPVLTMLSL